MDEEAGVFEERFELSGGRDAAREAQQRVLDAIEARSFDPGSMFAIRLALEEALTNAFKHGNQGDPDKRVTLECRVGEDRVELAVEDEGEGFDPTSLPDPTADENLEVPTGRGIFLMRAYMTEVSFEPPGNRVRMVFERGGNGEEDA